MNSRIETDKILLAEVKRLSMCDDPRAISLIYDHYFQRLLFFALSFVKRKDAAEEVVEDVLIKFWANKKNVLQIQSLKVYLFSAVKNQSLNYLESAARQLAADVSADELEVESTAISPLEHLILSEMTQALQVAVDSLPERCQMIFRLVREEGLKYKEVAEILNISVNTIDNQMAIAVRRICASLHIKKNGAPSKSY